MTLDFRPIPDISNQLGECPTWDAARNALLWCDIPAGKIHELTLDGGEIGAGPRRAWSFDGPVGCFALAEDDRLVVACGRSLLWLDRDTGRITPFTRVEPDDAPTRLNDGKVGPDGAFWVGSMDDTPAKAATAGLYRIDPAGHVERKLSNLITSNGLAWSADGTYMFHTDTRGADTGPRIDRWRFNAATGAMTDLHRIAILSEADGRPDGGATDIDGTYWSAGVTAGRLNLFTQEGAALGHHKLPAPAPTMPCFGGADLRTLFVTTLRKTGDDHPLSGSIFHARVATPGTPIRRFG